MADEIRFYRSTGKYGFLSNLYPCRVVINGTYFFDSAEHAYQYEKANDEKVKQYIWDAPTPTLACIVGHGLFPWMVVPNWKEIRVPTMKEVLWAKFTLNDDLEKKLLNTGDAILIETSKSDGFWGIGRKGKGENMLGKLLMEVRGEIKARIELKDIWGEDNGNKNGR